MRLSIEKSIIAMTLLIFLKPRFGMKVFRLDRYQLGGYSVVEELSHLLHVTKHLFSAPTWHVPVIVVLFRSTNTQCSVYSTGSSQKPSATGFDLAVVYPRAGLSHDIPVCLCIEVLGPYCVKKTKSGFEKSRMPTTLQP